MQAWPEALELASDPLLDAASLRASLAACSSPLAPSPPAGEAALLERLDALASLLREVAPRGSAGPEAVRAMSLGTAARADLDEALRSRGIDDGGGGAPADQQPSPQRRRPARSGPPGMSLAGPEPSPEPSPRVPSVVVCGLDWTLWPRPRVKSSGVAWAPAEGGGGGLRSPCGARLDLFPGARAALAALADGGISLALASRSHRPEWAVEWLRSLRVGERSVAELVGGSPVLFRDGPKALHVREIAERVGVAVEEVLFFDDRLSDVVSVRREGATAVHCPGGLSEERLREGLALHADREGGSEGGSEGGNEGGSEGGSEVGSEGGSGPRTGTRGRVARRRGRAARRRSSAARLVLRASDEAVVIEQCETLADGRLTGVCSEGGARIWLPPTAKGYRLGGPRETARGGAAADASELSSRRRARLRRVRDASAARAAIAGLLLCFAAGFGLGSHAPGAVPPPPPPATTTAAAAPAFERLGRGLTTGEQLARQQFRVEADKAELRDLEAAIRREGLLVGGKSHAERAQAYRAALQAEQPAAEQRVEEEVLAFKTRLDAEGSTVQARRRAAIRKMQLQVLQDEEGLREISRVVAERGPAAQAVQLGVFASDGQRFPEFSFIP